MPMYWCLCLMSNHYSNIPALTLLKVSALQDELHLYLTLDV